MEKIMSFFLGDQNIAFINIEVKDSSNNIMVQIESNRIGFFTNSSWNITSYDGEKVYKSLVKLTTKTHEIGWKLEYEVNNKKYTVKETTIMGMRPKFYNNKEQLVAEGKDPLLSDKIQLSVYSDNDNIYEMFSICYLLLLVQSN